MSGRSPVCSTSESS